MSEKTICKIIVEDKEGNEIVMERALKGINPPDRERAAVLIQYQLV